ncbi:MAG: DUF2202 domain-containing protein [Candidatus Delongbacteria bacterium]|nr:DUF2202 domain-containing protein [Candidatus Delongbacteria bacterium]
MLGLLIVGLGGGYLIFSVTQNDKAETSTTGQGNQYGQSRGVNKGNCNSDDCLVIDNMDYPVGTLSEEAKVALEKAIDDEYKAYSTYEATIDKFGMIKPFSIIIRAEENHISSLKTLFDKYGLEIPENNWQDKVTTGETKQEACQIGVDAEIANAKLYEDELFPAVTDYEDITDVFTNLMNTSKQKHLPAFGKCN